MCYKLTSKWLSLLFLIFAKTWKFWKILRNYGGRGFERLHFCQIIEVRILAVVTEEMFKVTVNFRINFGVLLVVGELVDGLSLCSSFS